jgi:hypothetical protein
LRRFAAAVETANRTAGYGPASKPTIVVGMIAARPIRTGLGAASPGGDR